MPPAVPRPASRGAPPAPPPPRRSGGIGWFFSFCQGLVERFWVQGQRGQSDADGVVERVGDGRRTAEGPGFADALGTEGPGALLGGHGFIDDLSRQVQEAWNLVLRERSIAQLAVVVEQHFLEQREAELHDRRAGKLRLDALRDDPLAAVRDDDKP